MKEFYQDKIGIEYARIFQGRNKYAFNLQSQSYAI